MDRPTWKVSLHGGHSGEFCEHAEGTLREILEAAVAAGYHTFGVSEHAPRGEPRFLYRTEIEKGYNVARLNREFEAYASELNRLADEFGDRLVVLRGFEAEVVPRDKYREQVRDLRERHQFDYIVGSVHYVNEISIDGPPEDFAKALDSCGGLEAFCVRYYETVAEMIDTLRPEVVGHLDLVRRNAPPDADLSTPLIRRAAERALEAAYEHGAILDLNTAGWRKNLGGPYPAPWLAARAGRMGVPFCFGDDSHRPGQVGAGIDDARAYLLENGIDSVTVLTRTAGRLERKTASLGA